MYEGGILLHSKLKKNLIGTWLLITFLVSMTFVNTSISASSAVLSAPVIVDTTKTAGSTVSIDIRIADVEKLFAFEFKLYYNTTILTATSASSYAPFTVAIIQPRINNTGGWTYVAFSMPMPEEIGFNTTQPTPIAKIDFTVNALGTSKLELENIKLTEPIPAVIPYNAVDGLFANVEMLFHDIAITDVTAPSNVPVDGEATVTVGVENQGDYEETFSVSLYYNNTLIENKTGITLSVGASTSLTFTWDTAGIDDGTYTLRAEASVHPDEVDTADNTFVFGEVAIGTREKEAPPPDFTLYIIGAVVIVIVLVILVYALRFRKQKPPK